MHHVSVPILSSSPAGAHLDLRASCQFTVGRHITTLFKECLAIMEQLHEEHWEALEKLHAALPPEYRDYVNLADHFTDEKRDRIRRAILARGNDCRRAVSEELDQYELTFRVPDASTPSP
jgi:hypothetical protein